MKGAPPSGLPARVLLEYERSGHVCTRGLVAPEVVKGIIPAIERVYAERELETLRQKVRVLLGEDAVPREATVRTLRRTLDALPEGSAPFLQVFNVWRDDPAVLAMLQSPAIAGTAASLLGCERVRLYQDSLFDKRPGDGPTHWHSDLAMAPFDTNELVTLWLPLQPVPALEDGGSGLIFASGSHRDVALHFWHGDPRRPSDASKRPYSSPEGQQSAGALTFGDATWHHGWLLHSAAPNLQRTPRRALAASFFADGARRLRRARRPPHDEDTESFADWVGDVRPGQLARHRLLPLGGEPARLKPTAASHPLPHAQMPPCPRGSLPAPTPMRLIHSWAQSGRRPKQRNRSRLICLEPSPRQTPSLEWLDRLQQEALDRAGSNRRVRAKAHRPHWPNHGLRLRALLLSNETLVRDR